MPEGHRSSRSTRKMKTENPNDVPRDVTIWVESNAFSKFVAKRLLRVKDKDIAKAVEAVKDYMQARIGMKFSITTTIDKTYGPEVK